MKTPLRFTYRHVDRSVTLEASAQELFRRLEKLENRIITCHVLVEGPAPHHRHEACTVKVELTVPGAYIHADSAPEATQDGDTYLALRSAFDNAKRQLQRFTTARSYGVCAAAQAPGSRCKVAT